MKDDCCFCFLSLYFGLYLFLHAPVLCPHSAEANGKKTPLSQLQHIVVRCTVTLWVRMTLSGFTEILFFWDMQRAKNFTSLESHIWSLSKLENHQEKWKSNMLRNKPIFSTQSIFLFFWCRFYSKDHALFHYEFAALSFWQIKCHNQLVEVRRNISYMLVKWHAFQSVISASLICLSLMLMAKAIMIKILQNQRKKNAGIHKIQK